jgi:hypothetical protein
VLLLTCMRAPLSRPCLRLKPRFAACASSAGLRTPKTGRALQNRHVPPLEDKTFAIFGTWRMRLLTFSFLWDRPIRRSKDFELQATSVLYE